MISQDSIKMLTTGKVHYYLTMAISTLGNRKQTHPPIIFRMGLTKEESMTKNNCCGNRNLRSVSQKSKESTS